MRDLRALRAFVFVAREGSVSRAADSLHLTQPAVSLKLKQFQEQVGCTLFLRHPQGLSLTPNGHALLSAAEKALAAVDAFDMAARTLHSTVRGKLRIGTIVDPEFIRLGAFLQRLVASAPQIETELHHGMSGTVLERLQRQELDIGFFLDAPGQEPWTLQEAPDIDGMELTRFDYYIIAPPGWEHRLENAEWVHLAQLPWIVTPTTSVHHRLIENVLEPLGVVRHRVAQVDQEMSMLDLVRAGVGMSLARDAIAIQEHQERGLTIVPGIRLPCALSIMWRGEQRDDPAIDTALNSLAQVWGQPFIRKAFKAQNDDSA
ncbi:LysR family transcriptional regulator [Modicisalibacter luteus]|uniref:LysR family transcriptional regulator n=2 Tax=Modicisalibacter luteus TaxID=453962 RepID=A0ABV7M4K7_9GAMM|nr:LysR family transcriptional regulator [Halomonas lutea]GHA87771.1 LysR family transcriptional regulator [Halomonas lutea]